MFTKENIIFVIIVSIVILLVGVMVITGCSGNSSDVYKVDYCGAKYCYKNAKDSYKAGTNVKLYFDLIATDTDYSFYLDGEKINYDYDENKGFIISFVMPEHDVKLECNSRNSMEAYIE